MGGTVKPLARNSYRIVPGHYYETPKELWGFRGEPARGNARATARAFLDANAATLGIEVAPLFANQPRIIHGLGAVHVILQQCWEGRRVHRAYVSVHIGAQDRSAYLVKSRAAPRDVLEAAPKSTVTKQKAARIALGLLRGRGQARVVGQPESMLYPVRDKLRSAWRVRIHRTQPRAEFIAYVNARTGKLIDYYDNLAWATGHGRVFLPHPMARDPHFEPLDEDGEVRRPTPESYAKVILSGLLGNGHLDGKRASTRLTKDRVCRRHHDFTMDAHRHGFEEVSAYYHVDRAIAYVESLGYTGSRRIFKEALAIDARGTKDDNSWYSPGQRTLTFGLGDVDDAEDGETVLHEFGHALQDAICPDFGQSPQAAAMGEGFGDYLAASTFESEKSARYRHTVMAWDGALFEGAPPCVRRVDSPRSYETFDHAKNADEHDNGEIWAATLWEVRELLGRHQADQAIIDSHFQLDGFTTFARGARAILDADRNLFGGAHQTPLKRIFHRRGIGPVE